MSHQTNSDIRRRDQNPAYWVSEYGVFTEIAVPGSKALRWATAPLTPERLDEIFEQSKGDHVAFARLVEAAHGVI